jgi:hypothetical protein
MKKKGLSARRIKSSSLSLLRKERKSVLISEFCLSNIESVCYVSRGKIGEGDTGKRDYRHRARTGCV